MVRKTLDICITFIEIKNCLKNLILYILLLTFGLNCSAQNFHLKLTGKTISENKVLDSMNYLSKHQNIKSITDEIKLASDKLSKKGYIENQLEETIKENDSSYAAKFRLGERIKSIHIYIGTKTSTQLAQKQNFKKEEGTETVKEYNTIIIKELIGVDKKDTIILPYEKTESFLSETLKKLEQNGYALAKLQLVNIQKKNNSLYAELQFESGQQRELNAIVVKFSESNKKVTFPAGHLKQINRKYTKSTFNQDVVRKINDDFGKFGFVNQIKYPEILFTKDTTKVYVYLEKRKSNTFDGFIGFTNNASDKLVFNGYLDLTLENALKAGEQFSLNWKSDGNNQRTFKASIDLPYLFKSPVGIKAQIYIFKQDSIFQNTKTAIDLGYFVDYGTRIYLGYQSTESSDIQNTNNSTISDFDNSYLTSNLEYSKFDYMNSLFPKKMSLSLIIGTGNRTTSGLVGTNKQSFININAMYNFYLNKKNCININYQNNFLKSDTYILNELYRFGGVKSIRGFVENSLQANFMTAIITEYRFIISPDLYINSILDYGYYKDNTTNYDANLLGIGLGMGLRTKNGNLKLSFSNGGNDGQTIKFSNTIANLNYNIEF